MDLDRCPEFAECGGRRHARVTRQSCESDVEKSVWTGRVGCARTEKNSGACFVDCVAFYRVVDSAGRGPWSRALVVHVDPGLGVAAIDAVGLRCISVTAKINCIEVPGSADMIQADGCIVGSAKRWVCGCNNSVLRTRHGIV